MKSKTRMQVLLLLLLLLPLLHGSPSSCNIHTVVKKTPSRASALTWLRSITRDLTRGKRCSSESTFLEVLASYSHQTLIVVHADIGLW